MSLARNGGRGGSRPKIIGDGVPDPLLISERVACDLFAGAGMTRHILRGLIDRGEILRRRRIINGRKVEGISYSELALWVQSMPIVPAGED